MLADRAPVANFRDEAILDQAKTNGGGQMRLSTARRPEQDQVGTGLRPTVFGAEGHDLGFGNGRNSIEPDRQRKRCSNPTFRVRS